MTAEQSSSRYAGLGMVAALVLPIILYWVLPQSGMTSLGSMFNLNWLLSSISLLVFGALFAYVAYLSCTRYLIIPIVAFFLYQMAEMLLPMLHFPNYLRTLYILYSVILTVLGLYKFRIHPNLKPLAPLFLFVGLNVLYVIVGYMVAPNYIYMPEFYADKPTRYIPMSYGFNLTIFLVFLAVAVYITFNAFTHNLGHIRKWFKYFLVFFLLGYSLFAIGAYFLNDIRFINILAGVKRVAGLNTHTNLFAFFINTAIIYIFSFLYTPHNPTEHPPRPLTLLSVFTGAFAILLSFSRANIGALVVLALANNILLAKNRAKSVFMTMLIILSTAALIMVVQSSGMMDVIGIITNRMEDDASSNFRPITWAYVLSQMEFDWTLFWGHGIGAVGAILNNLYSTRFFFTGTPYVYHPHNSYLHLLYDYGILGLLMYAFFLVRCIPMALSQLIKAKQIDAKKLMLLEMILFALITSFTDSFLFTLQVISFWILLVALYAETIEDTSDVTA